MSKPFFKLPPADDPDATLITNPFKLATWGKRAS
jgi:hypothetical protein